MATIRARGFQPRALAYSGEASSRAARAVDHARRVTGVVHVVDLDVRVGATDDRVEGLASLVDRHRHEAFEDCRQCRQAFQRGLRARELVVIESEGAVFVVDRDHALLEVAVLQRNLGALLALVGELVDVLAGDPFERRDHVGTDALVRLRVQVAQPHVARVEQAAAALGRELRRVRHHLDATGDHQVLHAGHDAGGGHVHGRDARPTETVQGDAARAGVPAGRQQRHPGDAGTLLAALGAAAPDHVVDFRRVDAIALFQRVQNGRRQVLRVQVRERATTDFADAARGAGSVDDPSFSGQDDSPRGYE
jgi:hypothetical protein